MLFRALAVSAALICGPVVAATYNYDVSIETNGTPNPATLNFDIDFDLVTADAAGSSAGLTVNSLNFNLGSTLLARFAGNALVIGGTAGGVGSVDINISNDDIELGIFDPQAAATPGFLSLAQGGFIIAFGGSRATVTAKEVIATPAVPLPASMPLLGAALAGLAFWRRRKAA